MVNFIIVSLPRFSLRASIPNLLFRLRNSVFRPAAFLSLISPVLIFQAEAASSDSISYSLRLESGAEQAYLLEVPPGIQSGADKISQGAAKVAAVAWAGGLDRDSAGLTNLGGSKPGGFYHATFIKVDSAEFRSSPVPNYLVQMNGKIGQIRQTFYADVLEDGRLVRPVPVSERPERTIRKSHRRHGGKQWGGSKWGGSGEKRKWGGAEQKKKWGGSGEKTKWGGAEQKQQWGGSGEKKKWGGAEEKPTPANQSQ
jgi:hypothetical protein